MTLKKLKIGDVCLTTDYVANGSFAALRENVKYLDSDGYAVLVRLTDFTKKWKNSFRYVSKHAYEFLKHSKLYPGDLIISNVGEPGKTFLVPDLGKPATLGPNSVLIRPDNSILSTKYLKYFIDSKVGQKLINSIVTGTTQKKFNKTSLRNLEITIPPLEAQQRIVAKLDTLFAEIDKIIDFIKHQIDEFNSLKLSIFKNILDGPKVKLGDLYEITSSKRVFKSEWKSKGVPFYRAREIVKLSNNKPFNNPIYISEEMFKLYSKKYGVPKAGDILITGVGTLGVTYLVKKNDKFYFKDGNIIWLKKKQDSINSNYINIIFNSPFVKSQITNSIGATVGTLTIQKAKELLLPYPSKKVQNEIMEKMNKIFIHMHDYENKVKKNIQNYIALKNSFLQNNLQNKSL